LKADQTPTGLASVTSSRLVFIDESAGAIRSSGRVTAHSEEILPLSEQRGATGPDIAPPRRLAAIQSSVAPSFGKTDIHTSQAALFVNPCPTSKERLAHSHARPQPADFRNSAMDVRDEPREVVARSLTAAEQVAQSPNVSHTRFYTASLLTAANCYSSGRRDDSWRRETGVDLKGRLCSYCTSR
jgi:hypothetical protein